MSIVKKIAIYFFVLSFSLSNISFFNMVLSYIGYKGNITLVSSAIYAFFNLFILIYFVYYVYSYKTYKMFLVVFLINLVYILPYLLNFNIRDIALYLMFPLPFSFMAGIVAVDKEFRKLFISVFYKLRYIYVVLGVVYICFLAFFSAESKGELIDFTYGNVAWVFLPPIYVYIGILIQKKFTCESRQNKLKFLKCLVFY